MYQNLCNFYGYPFQLLGNPFTAIVLGGTRVVAVRKVRKVGSVGTQNIQGVSPSLDESRSEPFGTQRYLY